MLLQLFGCDSLLTSSEFNPSSVDTGNDPMFVTDAMPLIAALDGTELNTLYPNEQHQEAAMLYYEAAYPFVDVDTGNTQTRQVAGSSEQLEFTERLFTHTSNTAQPVYALTSGFLFSLQNGQSVSYLLGGTEVTEDHVYVLKPFPVVYENWKTSQPAALPLLQQFAYVNMQLVPDTPVNPTDESEPCLINLIRKSTTKAFFEKVYNELKDEPPAETEDWENGYLQLFKEYASVPILIRGGDQIGLTQADSATNPSQRLTMFFSFNDAWNSNDFQNFFRYHRRRPLLAGHPLIARIMNQSVRAGTVDVLEPYTTQGVRTKFRLIEKFNAMQASGVITHHPLALDTEVHPHTLAVPRVEYRTACS
jgi:hypothetical protein